MKGAEIGVVDLFSGAGGLSLGFKNAGFRIVAGVEMDPFASQTYTRNFREADALTTDIAKVDGDVLLDLAANKGIKNLLVVGGPPCQPFSNANKQNNGHKHPYASSLSHFNRLIKEMKPLAFLFENVTAFSGLKGWNEFLRDFERAGYYVTHGKITMSGFGVPQERRRLFVAGFSNGSHFDISDIIGLMPPIKIKDAIGGLPRLPAGGGGDSNIKHPQKTPSPYIEKISGSTKRLYNHWSTVHSEEVVETIKHIKEGQSLLKQWNKMPRSVRKRFKNPEALHSNIYRRLARNRLAPTIVHARRAMLIHPVEHRIISVREAARLQSFPDSFRFFGGTDEEYQQVANAAPPIMAAFLAKHFRKVLSKRWKN